MSTQSSQADLIYVFGLFRLDPKESVLLRDGVPIPLSPKAFDVLVHLLGNHGHLVDKDDLLQSVWPDSIVEEGNLNLAVHQARKALGDDPGKPTYIQTVPKRGYRFIADVTAVSLSDLVLTKPEPSQTDVPSQPPGSPVGDPSASSKLPSRRRFLTTPSLRAVAVGFVTGLVLAFVIILEAGALRDKSTVHGNVVGAGSDRLQANAPFDEVEVKRVVKESQLAETLTIYTHPNAFDPTLLAKYWVPAHQGGEEIEQVRASINRLLAKGWRYGPQSKAELFEFRYAHIFTPGDYAEVGTIERWYIPLFREDGSAVLDRNVYLGPQQIDYKLRKINNTWLVQKSTTPRPRKR